MVFHSFFPRVILNMFNPIVIFFIRLPGPTTRVSAAGSEAKARGSISANNRRSQSFNNYDKTKPGLPPPTPTSSNDRGKHRRFWHHPICHNSGFIRGKLNFSLSSRSCKTILKLYVVNGTFAIPKPAGFS